MLSRFAYFNTDLFSSKNVLELGAGSGLAGITVKKLVPNTEVVMTDYHSTVLDNLRIN